MKGTVRTIDQLAGQGLVAPGDRAALDQVAARYAVAITPGVMETIAVGDPADGVARQFVPTVAEAVTTDDEMDDPIGDQVHSPVAGIVHRYPDRVLLMALQNCAVYCRFCFRREQVGPQTKGLSDAELDAALGYIAGDERIWEVILSGGDPMMLPAKKLARIADALTAVPHVRVMRLHTRIPTVAPERVTGAMVAALKRFQPTYVVVHVNHPDELTDEMRAACGRLVDAGIPMLSQSVLLAGVNDSAQVLERLLRSLVEIRIKPYYLHIADKARGTSHFRVGIDRGQALMRELRGRVSGLCQPTLMLDIPGGHGKVPVGPCHVERAGDEYVVEDVCGVRHGYEDG